MHPLGSHPALELALTVGASVLGFVAYAPYLRSILRGTTKPHAISWLLWSVVNGSCCLAQLQEASGMGTIVLASGTVLSSTVFVLAFFYGTKDVKPVDWACLGVAVAAIASWTATDNAETSVLILASINVVAFIPTLRKSVHRPYEEALAPYSLSLVRGLVSLVTMHELTIVASTWGVVVMLTNGIFVCSVIASRSAWRNRLPASLDALESTELQQSQARYASPNTLSAGNKFAGR